MKNSVAASDGRDMEDRVHINQSAWGPSMWTTMHAVTLAYPAVADEPTRAAAAAFMRSLPLLLPCGMCRRHLAEVYAGPMPLKPAIFETREAFGQYVNDLHDLITESRIPGSRSRHSFPQDTFSMMHRVRYDPLVRRERPATLLLTASMAAAAALAVALLLRGRLRER